MSDHHDLAAQDDSGRDCRRGITEWHSDKVDVLSTGANPARQGLIPLAGPGFSMRCGSRHTMNGNKAEACVP